MALFCIAVAWFVELLLRTSLTFQHMVGRKAELCGALHHPREQLQRPQSPADCLWGAPIYFWARGLLGGMLGIFFFGRSVAAATVPGRLPVAEYILFLGPRPPRGNARLFVFGAQFRKIIAEKYSDGIVFSVGSGPE